MARTKYYHVDEVAEILGITANEVRDMLNRKELKGHKQGRRWLVNMDQSQLENHSSTNNISHNKQETIYRFIKDAEHEEMIRKYLFSVKHSLYIATGDFKRVFIDGEDLVEILNRMVKRGIKVIVKCMNPHNNEIKQDFEFIICKRTHMKLFIFDENVMYVGSANLTPAALIERKKKTLNHETGILTTDKDFIKQALLHFKKVGLIEDCKTCKKKKCDYRKTQ